MDDSLNGMAKRLTMMLVVSGMMAVLMPLMADTETIGEYTWTYRINCDAAEIYKGSTSAAISPYPQGTVTIPVTLGGKPVTGIGSSR